MILSDTGLLHVSAQVPESLGAAEVVVLLFNKIKLDCHPIEKKTIRLSRV